MRILVIMDPPQTVLVDEDTSFALMLEAQQRGHRVDHCMAHELFLSGGELKARIRRATCDREADPPLTLGAIEEVGLAEVDAVWIRKDPPFDSSYLHMTLLLEHVRDKTLIMNDPRGLRDANEKLYATHFVDWMPETLISSDRAQIKAFTKEVGGRSVIKPLDGAGGEGVFGLTLDDPNLNAIIENTTDHGRRLAMIQRYLPLVTQGDKRILLIDGEPLGAILRVPRGGDLRSNIHVGGQVVAARLDESDRGIIAAVTPRLKADGLMFVGLDVIGGKLTEVNVTSPTGIQQMARLDKSQPEARVLDWVEAQVG